MNKVKLSLKLSEWPAVDRRAFERACDDTEDELGSDIGLAAFWSPDWRAAVIKRYGMWLHFLMRQGWLDDVNAPLDRLTKERVRLFRKELTGRVSSVTASTYFIGMSEALRVMTGGAKLPKYFRKTVRGLSRAAAPSRDDMPKLVAPYQFYRAALRRMRRYQDAALSDPIAAVKFEDGAMMGVLVAKAIRLRNLAGMLVGKNIKRDVLDQYELLFAKAETKNKVRIRAELPVSLTKYLDFYIDHVRPFLLKIKQRESDAMWVSSIGTDMARMTVYGRFCRATEDELGMRINPHFVRKVVATAVAFAMPEKISIAPALLDHLDSRTERESYRLAKGLIGSREHIRLLEVRRRRAIDGG